MHASGLGSATNVLALPLSLWPPPDPALGLSVGGRRPRAAAAAATAAQCVQVLDRQVSGVRHAISVAASGLK